MLKNVALLALLTMLVMLVAHPAAACDADDDDEDGCAYRRSGRSSIATRVNKDSEAQPRLVSTPPPFIASVATPAKSLSPQCKRYSATIGQMIVVPCSD
jgi:hypothetical protein